MILRRFTQITLCVAVSVGITLGAYWADHFRQQSTQMHLALRWARQISAQAEGLALEARQLEEQDPMGWATRLLSEGTDSRLVTVTKVQMGLPVQTSEDFDLDRVKGIFDYTKVLHLEDGTGVRVKILVGVVGFLGARSQFTHDLTVAIFCATCFLLLFSFTGGLFGFNQDEKFRNRILRWIKEAKTILAQLGVHIREMIREAQVLATAVKKSRGQVESLRERIHARIETIHARNKGLSESEKLARESEQLALSVAIETGKLGPTAQPLQELSQRLHLQIRELAANHQASLQQLRQVEAQLEPWATDADEAFHAYDDVFRATESMGGHIRRTTETLLNHAREMQELKPQMRKRK